ncbi:hypothetical protein Q1695_010737 [Nippostrongylus brasiliensis]|nr:hypothetical protein Q1695_010737 [Nippostrongylus brasiliensis]
MIRTFAVLFAVGFALVQSKKCVDGKNNVIRVLDTTNGKGKVIIRDLEIGTYDKNKKPICQNGKAQFTLPGNFKILKGTIQVVEPVKDGNKPLQLSLNLEKNSLLVGVVCQNGESKNTFVPNELCKYDLCKISSICGLLSVKTPNPIELAPLVGKEFIDIGTMPVPQLAGDWKLSVKLIQGDRVLGGVRVGKANEWLAIETLEGNGDSTQEPEEEESAPQDHEEL